MLLSGMFVNLEHNHIMPKAVRIQACFHSKGMNDEQLEARNAAVSINWRYHHPDITAPEYKKPIAPRIKFTYPISYKGTKFK